MIRHGREHTPEQAADHDDLARDPGLLWSALALAFVAAVAVAVGWWLGGRL